MYSFLISIMSSLAINIETELTTTATLPLGVLYAWPSVSGHQFMDLDCKAGGNVNGSLMASDDGQPIRFMSSDTFPVG